MAIVPYASRDLRFTFALQGGQSFSGGQANEVITVSGLRAQVLINNRLGQGVLPHHATAIIYGLSPNHINILSTAGQEYRFAAAGAAPYMMIDAGIVGGTYARIYEGAIWRSTFNGDQPNASFLVSSRFASMLQLCKISPTTFNGPTSITTVIQVILAKVPPVFGTYTVANYGVTAMLSYPYLSGPPMAQIAEAAKAANAYIAGWPQNTLVIYPAPAGSAVTANSGSPIVFSPASGLIGYPQFDAQYVNLRTIFDPSSFISPGQEFQIQSSLSTGVTLQAANGIWVAQGLTYRLSSQLTQGPWEMEVQGYVKNPITPAGNQLLGLLNWKGL